MHLCVGSSKNFLFNRKVSGCRLLRYNRSFNFDHNSSLSQGFFDRTGSVVFSHFLYDSRIFVQRTSWEDVIS